jgi:hypothetical protein
VTRRALVARGPTPCPHRPSVPRSAGARPRRR